MIPILKPIHYCLISSSTFVVGILFYTLYNDIIIIRIPSRNIPNAYSDIKAQRKQFKLMYWYKNKWHTEEKELLDSLNKADTLTYLVTSWLNLLHEEQVIKKNIGVQSVMLDSNSNEVSISFDRNPFDKENSTYQKLMLIESLLKTLRTNTISCQTLRLMVHHQPLNDYHLDFGRAWPMSGFLNNN